MGRESFASLGLSGYLAERIIRVDDIFEFRTAQEVEDAWQTAPEALANLFRRASKSGSVAIRGYLWELYVWSKLTRSGNIVTYEEVIPGRNTKFDFKVTTPTGYTFYVEAKSLGPNEQDLLADQTEFQGDLALEFRKLIRSYLRQAEEFRDGPILLALGSGFHKYFHSNFETIRCLYGQPSITINRDTGDSWNSWSDHGFWHPESVLERSFDGIIFLDGMIPGFSTFRDPELWLNPIAPCPMNIHEFTWHMNVYKSDENLYRTSFQQNFIWEQIGIYN